MLARRFRTERTRLRTRAVAAAQCHAGEQDVAHEAFEILDEIVVGELVAARGERAQPLERFSTDALRSVADEFDRRIAIEKNVRDLVIENRPATGPHRYRNGKERHIKFVDRPPQQIRLGRRKPCKVSNPIRAGFDGKGRIAEYEVDMRLGLVAFVGNRRIGGADRLELCPGLFFAAGARRRHPGAHLAPDFERVSSGQVGQYPLVRNLGRERFSDSRRARRDRFAHDLCAKEVAIDRVQGGVRRLQMPRLRALVVRKAVDQDVAGVRQGANLRPIML